MTGNAIATFDKYDLAGAYHWRECDPEGRAFNPALVARYEMVLSRAAGARALDIGAGDGYLTARLAERCGTVVGLEYEATGVALARQMLEDVPNATVEQGSTYKMSFPDDSFDVIVMADVIEHLDDPEGAICEMARVAQAGSSTYVTTPQWRPDRIWDHRHVKEFRPEELADLMATAYDHVEMVYTWPQRWSDIYHTRLGWHLLRFGARRGINPFLKESTTPEAFCQMMAIGRDPKPS